MEYKIFRFIGDEVWYRVCRRSLRGWLPHNFSKILPKGYVWVPGRFASLGEARFFIQGQKMPRQKVMVFEEHPIAYYWQNGETGMVCVTKDPYPPSNRHYRYNQVDNNEQ